MTDGCGNINDGQGGGGGRRHRCGKGGKMGAGRQSGGGEGRWVQDRKGVAGAVAALRCAEGRSGEDVGGVE